jgi:hypothetical protein
MNDFMDIIRSPVFYLKERFGDWTLFPSSGKKPFQWEPVDRAYPYLLTGDLESRFK